ncbi:hypothetical protein CEXT_801931 [Caerostris extrusa]|uniref:Uncharacterized protein n=1 Tax=Caerostris extrusa TaxID=172846 RepID=A0AAV4WGW2_CAEEX|nr:hypothetical protein CEXT_801931 [Caerostris extrusa]
MTISTWPLQHHRSPFQSIQPILEHQRLPSAVSDTVPSTSIRRHLVCIVIIKKHISNAGNSDLCLLKRITANLELPSCYRRITGVSVTLVGIELP